jgi:hypothetical protein
MFAPRNGKAATKIDSPIMKTTRAGIRKNGAYAPFSSFGSLGSTEDDASAGDRHQVELQVKALAVFVIPSRAYFLRA